MGNGTYACTCNDGFELTDEHSGVCKATSGVTELFYTSGEEIRAHEEGAANRETEIVKDQERIEGIDYDPKLNMIYWVDSQEKSIKRSFIPRMHAGVEIGHPQEIQPAGKGTAKLTDVSYDWVTGSLYWTEVDSAGLSNAEGRVVVAKADGRYKRSVVSTRLENPTSIVVDPEHGLMFWADSGNKPKIEVAWVDSKLNIIESMNEDGEKRHIVAQGTHLQRPLSIDVFESTMFWVATGNSEGGAVMKQDKFGRGVATTVAKNLQHPTSVKVFHEDR